MNNTSKITKNNMEKVIDKSLLENAEDRYNYTKNYTKMIIEETNRLVQMIKRINKENSSIRRNKVG